MRAVLLHHHLYIIDLLPEARVKGLLQLDKPHSCWLP